MNAAKLRDVECPSNPVLRFFFELKCSIWNKTILLWWYRLWIRKNEFHPSLNLDMKAYCMMNGEQRQKYLIDLYQRRSLAHERNLQRCDG